MSSISGAYKSIGRISNDLTRVYGRGLQDFSNQVVSTLKPVEDAVNTGIDYVTSPVKHVYQYTNDSLKELQREYNSTKDNLIFGLEASAVLIIVAGVIVAVYVGRKVL